MKTKSISALWWCLLSALPMFAAAQQPAQGYNPYGNYYQWAPQAATPPQPPASQPAAPPVTATVTPQPPAQPAAQATNAASAPIQQAGIPTTMGLAESRLGRVLTDIQGRTLYVSDQENSGVPLCAGPCSRRWLPFVMEKGTPMVAPFYPIARDDGVRQWAWNGRPLYRWIGDNEPGDVTGDGINGVWHAVRL